MDIQISSLPLSNNVQNDDILLISRGGADYSTSVNSLLSSVNDNINTVNTTLTNAVSQIDQRMKTLFVPLNYGQYWHNESTNIPNNGDLNEYLTPGVYYITDNSIGASIINGPEDINCCGELIVKSQFGQTINHSWPWRYLYQELKILGGTTFERNISSEATAGVYTYYPWRVTSPFNYVTSANNSDPRRICGKIDNKWVYFKYITCVPNITDNTGTMKTFSCDTDLNVSAYDIIDVRVTARRSDNPEYILPHVITTSTAGFSKYTGAYYLSGTTLTFQVANDTWNSAWTFRVLIYYTIL